MVTEEVFDSFQLLHVATYPAIVQPGNVPNTCQRFNLTVLCNESKKEETESAYKIIGRHSSSICIVVVVVVVTDLLLCPEVFPCRIVKKMLMLSARLYALWDVG